MSVGAVRYLRLFLLQLRASVLLAMQYRLDFLLDIFLALFATTSALIPLFVIYQARATVAGWTWPEALLVVGWFNVLRGILNTFIQPSLQSVVEHVRRGTLDFILIKPADAQFLISTSKFEPREITDSFAGGVIIVYALAKLGHVPSPIELLATAALLGCGAAILYAILVMVIGLAFLFVKVDNLAYLFLSVYDAARWPASVFRGFFAILFTFVIPLAIMTTFPALAVLGRLRLVDLAAGVVIAIGFLAGSRVVWKYCVRRYTSAGG